MNFMMFLSVGITEVLALTLFYLKCSLFKGTLCVFSSVCVAEVLQWVLKKLFSWFLLILILIDYYISVLCILANIVINTSYDFIYILFICKLLVKCAVWILFILFYSFQDFLQYRIYFILIFCWHFVLHSWYKCSKWTAIEYWSTFLMCLFLKSASAQ